MKMKKTYYLNKDVLPTIPVPHDCIIKKIRIEHKWLIFTFDNDTSYYDSVRKLSPNIRNLILKYHLSNPEDFSLYTPEYQENYKITPQTSGIFVP